MLSTKFTGQILSELRVNSLHFAVSCALCELGCLEELREGVERLLKLLILDIEVELRVIF